MCMNSETKRSSSTTTTTKQSPVPTTTTTTDATTNGSHNHNPTDPHLQQPPPPPLRGLSPRSVIHNSSSSSSSSSSDGDTRRWRSDSELRNRDDTEKPVVCGRPGWWRRRGRDSESRITRTTTPMHRSSSSEEEEEENIRKPWTGWVTKSTFSSSLLLLCRTTAAAILVTMGMIKFSLMFPFVLAPSAAIQTYEWAQYTYTDKQSQFDNTIWTYGTDYFLALCMMTLIHMIPYSSGSSSSHKSITSTSASTTLFDSTAYYTRGLLGSYMISVLAGGMAHQTFTTIALQNTTAFRFLWTICVGAVAMASAFMGAAASSLLQYDTTSKQTSGTTTTSSSSQWSLHQFVPILPVSFWFVYAIGITAFVMIGGFSFQRPACDIFVVGITQFPSTFYMMLVLYSFGGSTDSSSTTTGTTSNSKNTNSHGVMTLSNRMKYIACCGFILNAPLLPLYPILVQYTDWSLGMINTLLHTWLLMAWTCQGMSLRQIGVQWILQQEEQHAKEENESASRLLQPTLSQTIPDTTLSTSS